MHKLIPFMELMKEVSLIFDIHHLNPQALYKVFEDNQSCLRILYIRGGDLDDVYQSLTILPSSIP